MLALANALNGMSRAEAARAAAWIERQSLRDAVVRFNAEGLAGLMLHLERLRIGIERSSSWLGRLLL